jgi:hypothetical protein
MRGEVCTRVSVEMLFLSFCLNYRLINGKNVGTPNQDIAHTLVISLDTVKKHVSNLLGKLGASNRTVI